MNRPTPQLKFHASKHVEREKRSRGAVVAFLLFLLAALVGAAVWLALR